MDLLFLSACLAGLRIVIERFQTEKPRAFS